MNTLNTHFPLLYHTTIYINHNCEKLSVINENHPALAASYTDAARVNDSKGDLDKAVEYFHMAFKIKKGSLSGIS